ncbi:MAG: hypothetical protein AB8G11_23200 [Saprospiraceae bacterium]
MFFYKNNCKSTENVWENQFQATSIKGKRIKMILIIIKAFQQVEILYSRRLSQIFADTLIDLSIKLQFTK